MSRLNDMPGLQSIYLSTYASSYGPPTSSSHVSASGRPSTGGPGHQIRAQKFDAAVYSSSSLASSVHRYYKPDPNATVWLQKFMTESRDQYRPPTVRVVHLHMLCISWTIVQGTTLAPCWTFFIDFLVTCMHLLHI